MHWRKERSGSGSKIFYVAITALTASVVLTTALLVLHYHV
jgi:hypothetical protein